MWKQTPEELRLKLRVAELEVGFFDLKKSRSEPQPFRVWL
jgi:hypothetical protein